MENQDMKKRKWTDEELNSHLANLYSSEKYVEERTRFNQGIIIGIMFGLVANFWASIVYENIIKALPDLINN
ncbi:MAG: hypothetical protein V1725_00060 [archaeon]